MRTQKMMRPEEVRELQMVVPNWMEKILREAEEKKVEVLVTQDHLPFGTYTIALEVVS